MGGSSEPGQAVARIGFGFGSVVSVAGNVLSSRIPPARTDPGWSPEWAPRLDTQIFAAVWPIMLLLAIEIISRKRWPDNTPVKLVRWVGLGSVAVLAFVISYQHIRHVLTVWGYPTLSADVGPLVIDGLMIVSGAAMVIESIAAVKSSKSTSEDQPDLASESPEPTSRPAHIKLVELPQPSPQWPGYETPDFGPEPDLSPAVSRPRPETNGHRASALVRKTRSATRTAVKSSGPTVEELVSQIRTRLESGENLTKRQVQEDYSVGSAKAGPALREARDGMTGKEES